MNTNFTIPDDTFVHPQRVNARSPSNNRLFYDALANPIGYPPLDKVVYPGDSLTVVLLDDLVAPSYCVTEILSTLSELITEVAISVVSNVNLKIDDQHLETLNAKLTKAQLNVTYEVHDSSDTSKSAQISINKDGEPLHINRTIFDADVLLPVGANFADCSIPSSIFPAFGTADTIQRFKSQNMPESQIKAEIRMVETSLGLDFGVNVHPNPGGSIERVICGERHAVLDSTEQSRANWQITRLTQGKTVIATIETPTPSWEQFFQALANAAGVCTESERIVICSEISEPPSPLHRAVLELQFESDQDEVANVLSQVNEAFHQIPSILFDKSVYLKSNLPSSEVEELGLGYVENDVQIQQIIDNSESGVFLRDAQLCEIVEAT